MTYGPKYVGSAAIARLRYVISEPSIDARTRLFWDWADNYLQELSVETCVDRKMLTMATTIPAGDIEKHVKASLCGQIAEHLLASVPIVRTCETMSEDEWREHVKESEVDANCERYKLRLYVLHGWERSRGGPWQ